MRWFWITLIVLIAGAGLLVVQMRSNVPPTAVDSTDMADARSDDPTGPRSEVTSPSAVEAPVAHQIAAGPEPQVRQAEEKIDSIDARPIEQPAASNQSDTDAAGEILDLLLGIPAEPTRASVSDDVASGADQAAEGSSSAPARKAGPVVVEREDGSFLIEQRFVVYGRGTEASPFRIPWDLLVAAQETYRPRLKKTELPEWAEIFSGMHVQISGYLTLPTISGETEELLVMRNEWDGCCIGVPPTPYDSIEVKLMEPARMSRHMINFGTVTGRFVVNPYLWKDWLISLYVIEEAKVNLTGI